MKTLLHRLFPSVVLLFLVLGQSVASAGSYAGLGRPDGSSRANYPALANPAALVVPPGFTVTTLPLGREIDGLILGPGGPYGTDLYVAVSGAILRVNPDSGTFTTFASGLTSPTSFAFDMGTFGTGLLYVSQNDGSVVTISSAGSVHSFSRGGTLFSSNDLAFPPPASLFGHNLFVSNGPFGYGNLSKVTANGVNSVFVPTSSFAEVPIGLGFPPALLGIGRRS